MFRICSCVTLKDSCENNGEFHPIIKLFIIFMYIMEREHAKTMFRKIYIDVRTQSATLFVMNDVSSPFIITVPATNYKFLVVTRHVKKLATVPYRTTIVNILIERKSNLKAWSLRANSLSCIKWYFFFVRTTISLLLFNNPKRLNSINMDTVAFWVIWAYIHPPSWSTTTCRLSEIAY
jgi:hypothetical protein